MSKIKDYTALVVEDEKPLLQAIKNKLSGSGFSVATARSVDQALGYLEDLEKVHVIWLDHYLLGKEDGLDLVAKIKEDKSKWKDIPIFIVSNTASSDKIGAYLGLGVDKYYTKSDHRLDEIIADIKKIISK